jgi:membrane protein required for colicin V production
MQIFDILVLVVVGGAAILGWRKGLATQVASITSLAVSYVVAVRFRGQLAQHIDAVPPWNTFAAMLILFLGTSLVIWLLFRQIRASIERLKLGEFDRQMGFLFGALKGVVLAGLLTLFAFTLLGDTERQAIVSSRSGYWIAKFMQSATAIMPGEVQNVVEPYLATLERGFDLAPGSYLGTEGSPDRLPEVDDYPETGYPSLR